MLIIDKQIAKAEEQVCKSNQILGHVEFFMAPAHLAPFLSQQTCLFPACAFMQYLERSREVGKAY